jgi:hypothetical protein
MERQSESSRRSLRAATEKYLAAMPGSPAEEYLGNRGLTADSVKPIVDRFRLGFVEEPFLGDEQYRGFLAIPYLRWSQEQGWSVVSIRYRCIHDHEHTGHGKYMTKPGDRGRMFNTLALLQPSPVVAITEGELDAITAQACGIPTVGLPGAQAWQRWWREPFLGYRDVYILADGDEAGYKMGEQVARHLPNSRMIPMPAGEDVNSLVLNHGKQALLERINA